MPLLANRLESDMALFFHHDDITIYTGRERSKDPFHIRSSICKQSRVRRLTSRSHPAISLDGLRTPVANAIRPFSLAAGDTTGDPLMGNSNW